MAAPTPPTSAPKYAPTYVSENKDLLHLLSSDEYDIIQELMEEGVGYICLCGSIIPFPCSPHVCPHGDFHLRLEKRWRKAIITLSEVLSNNPELEEGIEDELLERLDVMISTISGLQEILLALSKARKNNNTDLVGDYTTKVLDMVCSEYYSDPEVIAQLKSDVN